MSFKQHKFNATHNDALEKALRVATNEGVKMGKALGHVEAGHQIEREAYARKKAGDTTAADALFAVADGLFMRGISIMPDIAKQVERGRSEDAINFG